MASLPRSWLSWARSASVSGALMAWAATVYRRLRTLGVTIGRFGGLIFIVAASVLLPASRHRLTAAAQPVAA